VEGRSPVPPAAQTLGFEFISSSEDSIEVAFRASQDFTTPYGDVLGGFLAAMLYDTVGPAVLSTLGDGEFIKTLDLSTYFLRPASPGRLIGRGRILNRTDEIVVVEASLADESATVATATATILVVSIETPDAVGD
jgi:uncharacterized protein (TIGR00369 family)